MGGALLRRRGIIASSGGGAGGGGGDVIDPPKLDPVNYISADPGDDSPTDPMDAVDGKLILKPRTVMQEVDEGPSIVYFNSYLILGAGNTSPSYVYDPAHIFGDGTSDLVDTASTFGDGKGLQLHSPGAGPYLQWDDRLTMTDEPNWLFQTLPVDYSSFPDGNGPPATSLIAFGAMDTATGERLQARFYNDFVNDDVYLFLEKVHADTTVEVLASRVAHSGGGGPTALGRVAYLRKDGKRLAMAVLYEPTHNASVTASLAVTLSDADAERFSTGQFGWGWDGANGPVDADNWVLGGAALSRGYPFHSEYTYGQVYTPSLDAPVGPDVMVWAKFTLDDAFEPGTLHLRDLRWNPQTGLVAKWSDARTGDGVAHFPAPTALLHSGPPDPLDIGDTTGFPASGVVQVFELPPSERVATLNYSGKTGTELTGTSWGDWTDGPAESVEPWSTAAVIRPRPDPSLISGIFAYFDHSSGGLGVITDWLGDSWDDFGDPDELHVEVGEMQTGWTTLAADWHFDGNPFTAQPDIVLTDPARVPAVYDGALIFEGDPSTLYDPAGHPYESGQSAVYVKWTGKALATLTGVEAKAYNGPPSQAGVAHVFPAGTKIALDQWNVPLVDGVSIPGSQGYGNRSEPYLDKGYTLTTENTFSGDAGALRAGVPYWRVLRIVGNEVTWEFWDQDPFGSGTTYVIRIRIVINDATRIAHFGAAVSGGVGPMGYSQPYSAEKILNWGYGAP